MRCVVSNNFARNISTTKDISNFGRAVHACATNYLPLRFKCRFNLATSTFSAIKSLITLQKVYTLCDNYLKVLDQSKEINETCCNDIYIYILPDKQSFQGNGCNVG